MISGKPRHADRMTTSLLVKNQSRRRSLLTIIGQLIRAAWGYLLAEKKSSFSSFPGQLSLDDNLFKSETVHVFATK
jgi:hypothetical protein